MTSEAQKKVDYLASIPTLAHTIVTREVAQEILLGLDGELMAQGLLWRIVVKSIGVGLVELSCKRWES